ncbi:MAG: DUF6034 family protein, partial [Clostridiales bacterium]|nr:DUF6034 family protein [Clostridiales bacterium]
DGETPESIREYIAELEEKFKNAPDVVPENYYVDTPAYNDEGDIWLRMEYGDGRKEGFIAASLYSDYFWYERRDKGDLSMQSSAQLNSDNDIAKWRNLSRENLEKMEQNPMDAGTAMEIALQVMAELGITDMQLADVEPELLGGEKYDEHALRLTFVRECGGIPITMKWYRGFRGDVPQPEISYAPSLGNETVIFTISEAGVVESFEWEYAAEIIEAIAADTQLLPMDEIKERIVRQIYYENAYWDSEGFAPATFSHCTVHIEKLELKYAYISVRHEPENALIVPVWVVSYRVLLAGYSNDYVQVQTILIHALDGGTVTTYH